MRSSLLLASLLLGGCSFDWDGLRPLPGAGTDVPATSDAQDAVVASDVLAPQDVTDVLSGDDVVDAGAQPDVVDASSVDVIDAPPGADVVDVPAAMDVVDVPPARDVVDVPPAMDVVDVPPARDVVDVPPARDVVDVPPVMDTGPVCTGLSCPCAPSNPTGYCRVGEQCVSGACAATTAAGALVITEIMNDTEPPIGEPAGEWFEVYNPAAYAVDIRGMQIRDAAATSPVLIPTTGPALLVLPRAYALIARTATLAISGGPVVALATYDSISLNNGPETLTISTAGGEQVDSVSYGGTGWTAIMISGRSLSLRPGILDATMNNTATNWCAAGTSYASMNFGTPGAPNSCM